MRDIRDAGRLGGIGLVVFAGALAFAAGAASAPAPNLSGEWQAVYHCEAGDCAGQEFPATDVLEEAPGSSAVTGHNAIESITGRLEGHTFHFKSFAGAYTAEGTLTVSSNGSSWTGQVHDSNGTSGTYAATRVSGAPSPGAATASLAPVSGTVLVKPKGAASFVALATLQQIPFGAVIEATNGRVKVTTSGPHGAQTAEYFGGQFVLTRGSHDSVLATLSGGDFAVCPTARERSHLARTSARRGSAKHVVRKLWTDAHGSFTTRGNYAAAAVQGTEWLTEDLCDGTLIKVTRDKVRVTDLVNHRRALVRAGQSYLAKAP